MARSIFYSFRRLLFTTILILPITKAQVDTTTQQITTFSAFPLQKDCAQGCFINTGFCRNDILGSIIGCAVHTDCYAGSWLAKNDCYCRQDLQGAAQSYLSSCVSRACKEGDVAIDASTAGSIYEQYCVQKGFPAAAPATILATTTGPGGLSKTTAVGVGTQPTGSSTEQNLSSQSHKLSTPAIVGIAVGGVVVLAIFLWVLKRMHCFGGGSVQQPQYPQHPPPFSQQPVYPPNPYPEPYYPKPHTESEVYPEDSISVVSGMPRPAPTLVSAAPGYPPRW
ncbi:hypothetical protein K505DRAFT_420508 [Melanomma pulvis-pyrius CBS 109.77]|uniref:Extracellular membrane protein CFEM domain-containing protein n=1 Tax=Melanomma pulvis-pyrius CBS 109.77 TaxID=1314802 RepID=A0A6A6X0F3_9PLEO|nr:hypothetical protein K505DRAFT_420508 [Melanomma pulvis-pyrius CBS 109.77]